MSLRTDVRLAYVPVTVERPCAVSPRTAFDVIAPIDLTTVFLGWGPFPAVTGVANQTGSWDTPGRSRNPRLSDGSTAAERLTEYTPGHSFAYELSDFTGSMRFLVGRVRGEWTMTPDGYASVVRWTYAFFPLPRRRWLMSHIVGPLWRRYAERSLQNAVSAAESRTEVNHSF